MNNATPSAADFQQAATDTGAAEALDLWGITSPADRERIEQALADCEAALERIREAEIAAALAIQLAEAQHEQAARALGDRLAAAMEFSSAPEAGQ